jgi:hypothetical protein
LTEIYLCHACSYHEIEYGNSRAGYRYRVVAALPELQELDGVGVTAAELTA